MQRLLWHRPLEHSSSRSHSDTQRFASLHTGEFGLQSSRDLHCTHSCRNNNKIAFATSMFIHLHIILWKSFVSSNLAFVRNFLAMSSFYVQSKFWSEPQFLVN
jgi:hypothetical protein